MGECNLAGQYLNNVERIEQQECKIKHFLSKSSTYLCCAVKRAVTLVKKLIYTGAEVVITSVYPITRIIVHPQAKDALGARQSATK